jgi:hypothetical protein
LSDDHEPAGMVQANGRSVVRQVVSLHLNLGRLATTTSENLDNLVHCCASVMWWLHVSGDGPRPTPFVLFAVIFTAFLAGVKVPLAAMAECVNKISGGANLRPRPASVCRERNSTLVALLLAEANIHGVIFFSRSNTWVLATGCGNQLAIWLLG